MACDHPDFEMIAKVFRLTDSCGGPVTGYHADIRLACKACRMPFEFIGVPPGHSTSGPRTSVDGTELRAPVRPSVEVLAMGGVQ